MTTFDSLRDFLAHLESNGQLLTVREQVAPEPDLGAAARAVSDLGEDSPALLFEVKGPNRLGIQPAPAHDIAIHLRQAEERGEDLRVAIAIGNDPVISCVAAMPILYDQSECEMAGALRGTPYPVVHSRAPARDRRAARRIHGTLFGRAVDAGDRDQPRFAPAQADFRKPVYRHALDRDRLHDRD